MPAGYVSVCQSAAKAADAPVMERVRASGASCYPREGIVGDPRVASEAGSRVCATVRIRHAILVILGGIRCIPEANLSTGGVGVTAYLVLIMIESLYETDHPQHSGTINPSTL